jgi:hypothetical protein
MEKCPMPDENDGGYYAIKGFLYQFDKTLMEVLRNPKSQVGIERRQDVDYQNFVIQVKHRETQQYKDYKINKPVRQLIEMFKADQTQKFCLYCHFKDRDPCDRILTLTELDAILGDQSGNYTPFLKERFVEAFHIQFSEDFEAQFLQVIDLIKSTFPVADDDMAYIYHSLLRSKLLDISIKTKGERLISKRDLVAILGDAEKTVFYTAYSKYLDRDKYERLVKKEFFTFKSVNIENFERLFVIQCDEGVSTVDLNKLVASLIRKYFRRAKSPQPYLCLTGLCSQSLVDVKQNLLDGGVLFDDGTYFNGDRFRLDRIVEKRLADGGTKIKLVNPECLDRVLNKVKFHEMYQFYLNSPISIEVGYSHTKIQIVETKQVLRMLN